MEALDFATALLARGIEFLVRKNGLLYVWPKAAVKYLTVAEHEFINAHCDELKALVVSKALGEATVTWEPPGSLPPGNVTLPGEPENEAGTGPVSQPAAPEPCRYCLQSPCVGPEHRHFWVLHWNDPKEIERRAIKAAIIYRDTLRARLHFGIY